MMQVCVCEKLKIKEPTREVIDWCKQNLIIQNPEYHKRQQMGKWTGDTPQDIWMFERVGDELWLLACIRDGHQKGVGITGRLMQKYYKKYQKGVDILQCMVYICIRINQQYHMTGGHTP